MQTLQRAGPRRYVTALSLTVLLFFLAASGFAQPPPKLPIATVWREGGLWVSVRDAAVVWGFQLWPDAATGNIAVLKGNSLVAELERSQGWRSRDGRLFLPVRWLAVLGAAVQPGKKPGEAVVGWNGRAGYLTRGPRTIAVDLRRQALFAREGKVLVHQFRVSTGKMGDRTPPGSYKVLGKKRLHISRTYPKPTGGARMPYALRFYNGYFLHGYHRVPRFPASSGCIRLRIPEARLLYGWASVGTPVIIYRSAVEKAA